MKNLGKTYSTKVLEEVTMKVSAGTFMVVLGENGSGKTTFFTCLLGLQKHEGEVELIDESGLFPDRTGITAVLEKCVLYPQWNVRANINYQLNDGKGHLRRQVKELVPDRLLRVRASKLSTGQAKIVMLAIALASNAPVLLLDEFSNGLDRHARTVIRDLLKQACSEGRIILATGHDLSVFEGLPDRISILRDGRLEHVKTMPAATESLEEFYESHIS